MSKDTPGASGLITLYWMTLVEIALRPSNLTSKPLTNDCLSFNGFGLKDSGRSMVSDHDTQRLHETYSACTTQYNTTG